MGYTLLGRERGRVTKRETEAERERLEGTVGHTHARTHHGKFGVELQEALREVSLIKNVTALSACL